MKKRVSTPIKLIYWGIATILFFFLSGFPDLAQGAPAGTGQLPFLSPPQPQPTESDLVEPPRPTRLAALAFIPFLMYWNLLGFQF
jgi:hypothetical protein